MHRLVLKFDGQKTDVTVPVDSVMDHNPELPTPPPLPLRRVLSFGCLIYAIVQSRPPRARGCLAPTCILTTNLHHRESAMKHTMIFDRAGAFHPLVHS